MTNIGMSRSGTLLGVEAETVTVEADVGGAVPNFLVLGLADKSVQECRDRIRAAAQATGYPLPPQRITVNLAPANRPKAGTHFDLPILMSIMDRQGLLIGAPRTFFAAELGLDGTLKPVRGVLPMILAASREGVKHAVVARENLAEAELVPGVESSGYAHLNELFRDFLEDPRSLISTSQPRRETIANISEQQDASTHRAPDLADIAGQAQAKYALEVAAAGRHHMLMIGPPGAGKTMLAQSLPSILPALSSDQAIAATAISSLWEPEGSVSQLRSKPAFVDPHHHATTSAIIGSGRAHAPPGAITQAHLGVLFLDEAPEFKRDTLEALRQPLESGEVTIMRSGSVLRYPCDFQLVMAANPCPCGFNTSSRCRCTPQQRHRYATKISAPLLDRIDLQVRVEPVRAEQLHTRRQEESSTAVAQRVTAARARQRERLAPFGITLNSQIGMELATGKLRIKKTALASIDRLLERGTVTARGYLRILRTAWTLADLNKQDDPDSTCVDAAYSLRMNY